MVIPVSPSTSTKGLEEKAGCSVPRAVANLVMTAVGVGVLALPNAVANAGWVAGPLLLILAWGLTQLMMTLLFKCMFMNPSGERFESYEAVGKKCFGVPGQVAVSICLYGGVFCICSLMVILMGITMTNLIPSVGRVTWILIFVFLMLPLTWLPSLKEIGLISVLGVAATGIAAIFVIAASYREATSGNVHEHSLIPSSIGGLGLSFTNFMNSFTCAPVIPSLVADMKNPEDFPKVAFYSFATITLIFGSIGFAGYAGWGVDMLNYDTIVSAVAASSGPDDFVNYVVQITFAFVSFSHLLVLFSPLAKGAESAAQALSKSGEVPLWLRRVLRTLILAACTAVAIFVPNFGTLFNLVGSTVVMFLQIIFPAAFFLVLVRLGAKHGIPEPYKSSTERTVYLVVLPIALALGLFGLVLGTYQGILPLVS